MIAEYSSSTYFSSYYDNRIRFTTVNGSRPAPFAARNAPEFNGYFNALWQELEVHVEG